MVNSVVAVPKVDSVRRDQYNSSYSESKDQASNGTFAKVLEDVRKDKQNTPMDCHTISYGKDSKLQSFVYQPRDYHFWNQNYKRT